MERGGLIVNVASTLNFNGATWPNSLTLNSAANPAIYTLASDLNVSGALIIGVSGAATTTINQNHIYVGGNLSTISTLGIVNGTTNIILNGTGTWTSAGGVLKNNLDINTVGTITITGNVYYNTGILTYTSGIAAGTGTLISNAATTFNTGAFLWPNMTLNAGAVSAVIFTLSSNLNVTGTLDLGAGSSTTTINGYTIYTGGLRLSSNAGYYIIGTTNFIFNGTGTWSSTIGGRISNNLTINTIGTLTILGTVYYDTGALIYTAGNVITAGSTLALFNNTTINTSGMTWGSVSFGNSVVSPYNVTYTLSSDLNVGETLNFINSTWTVTINQNNINVGGNLTVSSASGAVVNGTTNIILNGTGTWSEPGNGTLRNNLTINSPSGTITISGNVYYNTGTLAWTSGIPAGTGILNLTAATTLNTGTFAWPNVTLGTGTYTLSSALNISGNLTIAGNATFSGNYPINCTNVSLGAFTLTLSSDVTCSGTLLLTGAGAINGAGKSVNINGNLNMAYVLGGTATVVMAGNGTWSGAGALSTNLTFNTSGTIIVSSTVYYNTRTLTYTAGTVTTTSSTLNIAASATLNTPTANMHWNNITISGNSTLTLTSGITLDGNLSIGAFTLTLATSDITVNGNLLNTAASAINGAGRKVNVKGDFTFAYNFAGSATVTMTGTGTISGAGNLTINLTMNTSGIITVTGTVNYNTGTLDYVSGTGAGTGTLHPGSSTIFHSGAFAWPNVLLNEAAVTYTLSSDLTIGGNLSIPGTNLSANWATTLNGAYNIYVGGNFSTGGASQINVGAAPPTIVFNGTGAQVWSSTSSSALVVPVSFNFSGTLSLSGTIRYGGTLLKYLGGNTTIGGTGTLTTVYYSTTFNTGALHWPNISLSGENVAYALSSDLNVDGNFTIATSVNSYAWAQTISGNYTIYVGGNFSFTGGSVLNLGATYPSIVLNGTGTWSETDSQTQGLRLPFNINTSGTITISGNIYHNTGAITYTTGTVVATGSTLNVAGSTPINTSGMTWNNIIVSSGTLTNNSVTSNGLALAGNLTGAGTLLQTTNSVLTLGGTSTISVLTATATGNTVVYNSTTGSQTVKNVTYNNLTFNNTGQTATLGGGITINGNLNIMSGAFDVSSSNYAIALGGNFTNNGIFNGRSGTVTLSGTVQQTLSGVMTVLSAFYNLIITNVTGGSPSDCALTNFTPSVIFGASLTSLGTYTVVTANVRVQYTSGATYTFNNINWNGQASNTKIYFRNSALTGNWHLKVTGTQTAVSYINISRSDALIGNQIASNNGTNGDCGNNINWLFPAASGAGDKLKETGTTHWTSPNTGATNSSGFTALPGGYSFYSLFGAPGPYGFFWTSTYLSTDTANAWNRILSYLDTSVVSNANNLSYAYSVRCVKNN